METIRRSRRRLAISLLTIFAMVFTMIPYMGTEVAEATTNDLVQTYTPTEKCPVSKVEFVKVSDGQYNLKVNYDLSVYTYLSDGVDYFYDLSIKNKDTGDSLGGQYTCIGSKPSGLGGVTRTYECKEDKIVTWNQEVSIKFEVTDSDNVLVNNPAELVCKAPAPFTGFTAVYIEGESDEYVEVQYESYYGDDYKYNIFLRENTSAGTVKVISSDDVYKKRTDNLLDPATKYIYYVAKQTDLQKILPDFYAELGSTEIPFTAAEKAKLRTISAYAAVEVPGPRIVEALNLKAIPGVRKAKLTWEYDYETIEPNVSGFYVREYASNGTLRKEYIYTNYKIKDFSDFSATYSIPYKGTYYFTVTPYYVYEGKPYEGNTTAKVACTSKSLSAAAGSVTKISDKKARITIKKAEGSTGTIVYQYTGGKWVKLGSTTGTSYTTTKNTAGKKKYRLLSYITENSTTYKASKYSSNYSPKANVQSFSYSSYPSSYPKYNHYWRPTKVSYSGNKVLVNGKFINTHLFAVDYVKIKITVKCQGKVIGTKTVSSGYMRSNQVKKMSVKLDYSKTGYDLRAGIIEWSYKVISWK